MEKRLLFDEWCSRLTESATIEDFSFAKWLVESADPSIRAGVAALSNDEALKKATLIMELVQQKLFKWFPLFRPFYSSRPPIASIGAGDVGPDGIGTMCTNGSAIFYDPKFVVLSYEQGKVDFFKGKDLPSAMVAIRDGSRHPMDYSLFVIVHEIMHCALKHFTRHIPSSEHLSPAQISSLWNLACDFEINHILKDDAKGHIMVLFPGGVDADDPRWGVEDKDKEFFKTQSAESIFRRLLDNIEAKKEEEKQKQSGEDQEDDKPEDGEPEDGDENGGDDGDSSDSGDNSDGTSGDSDGDDSDGETQLKPGDVIYDDESGQYGTITSISGDDIEFEPISEEEARRIVQNKN